MSTNRNADTELQTLDTRENGASSQEHWHPALATPPDQLEEPELSTFRKIHQEIGRAQELLATWQQAWNAVAPLYVARYDLGPEDQIDAEGRIQRK